MQYLKCRCSCICLITVLFFCFLGSSGLYLKEDLAKEVFNYRLHTFSANTKKSYQTHIDSYLRFCTFLNIPSIPASSYNICLYAAFLARSLKSASVRQYVRIIGLLHKEFNLQNPLTDNWMAESLFRGIKRVKGASVNQKLPITIDILFRIWKTLNFRSSLDSSFWAICLTAFFGMFRKSHLLTCNMSSFSPDKQFTKSDFLFHSWGVVIKVRWSKTIQFRDRVVSIPLSYIPDSPLCPVHAILHAFSFLQDSHYDGQAFSWVDPDDLQNKYFSYRKFLGKLRFILSLSLV